MLIGLAACARVAQQRYAEVKVIRRLAAIELHGFAEQMHRRVIFLALVTGAALVEIMLGQLRLVAVGMVAIGVVAVGLPGRLSRGRFVRRGLRPDGLWQR